MIEKPFDAIGKADIDALIANGVTESKTIEYKQELPAGSDDAKKEFLADVSSFANASGGDIIYGIKAAVDAAGKKTGGPQSVQPITATTPDDAKLRLESTIGTGIRPTLRVQIKEVTGWGDDRKGFVILVHIPKSFASPHMVTFKGTSRFYSRHSSGKSQLEIEDIRTAFLATESQAERIKHFREDRLGKIMADETPVVLEASRRLVFHLIPIASFLSNERLDLSNGALLATQFPPIFHRPAESRYNIDGFLTWIPAGNPTEHRTPGAGYCQLFAHGAIEAVSAVSVLGGKSEDGRMVILSAYEGRVVGVVRGFLGGYSRIGVAPPVAIALTLLNCKGARIRHSHWDEDSPLHSIDRDVVILPDVVIDSFDVDVPRAMKPIFDAVWNACGFPYSFNYDDAGKWQLLPD